MRARIYDKETEKYYISEVYGIINRVGDWYIVDHPNEADKVKLIEYLDFSSDPPYDVNIEIIDINQSLDEHWIYLDKSNMNDINGKLKRSKKLHYFRGFESTWNSRVGLIKLLECGVSNKADLSIGKFSTKLEGWNYIEHQNDIDKLIKAYSCFHDSVLKELSYISGEYYDKAENVMRLNIVGSKQVKLIFNSDWADEIEIILLAPRIVHLIPGEENYTSDLYDASIFIKDCMVYFYDSYIDDIPEEYSGTYFKSMGMMWRYTQGNTTQ